MFGGQVDLSNIYNCLYPIWDGSLVFMATDIVLQLRDLANQTERQDGKSTITGAISEIERLRAQVKAAHKILSSESFGWLVIGSEHEVSHWKMLSPYIDAYWDEYGTYFRPKPSTINTDS